jgi:hypothetical protein
MFQIEGRAEARRAARAYHWSGIISSTGTTTPLAALVTGHRKIQAV